MVSAQPVKFKEQLRTQFFQTFFFRQKFIKKCLKKEKRLETAEKSVLTSFWVHAATKSWSIVQHKYVKKTFVGFLLLLIFLLFVWLCFFVTTKEVKTEYKKQKESN